MTPDSCERASLTTGAWWFDGKSGRRLRASLHFAGGEVRAENENGERRDAALSDVEISSRIGAAPRHIAFADGARVFVDDNDFIDAMLKSRGVARRSFAIHSLESKWTATIIAAVCAWGILAAALIWGLPAASAFAADRIPRAQISALGDRVYEQLRAREIVADSRLPPAAAARAREIFDKVAADLAEEGDNFRLLTHHFSPNAFALPGGRVLVSDALIKLLSDDELAAVFAHEIAHIRRRHGMRAVLHGSASALLVALSGDLTGVSFAAILLNLGYSRDSEREADCFAYAYLLRRNMSPSLIADALAKMSPAASAAAEETSADSDATEETTADSDADGDYIFRRVIAGLSTHPQTEERKNPAAFCDSDGAARQ